MKLSALSQPPFCGHREPYGLRKDRTPILFLHRGLAFLGSLIARRGQDRTPVRAPVTGHSWGRNADELVTLYGHSGKLAGAGPRVPLWGWLCACAVATLVVVLILGNEAVMNRAWRFD
jgi:hypothetical protein